MNIRLFVLAVLVGIAIAEVDNSKKVSLPLVFPTSIYSTKQKILPQLLRNEDETKRANFRDVGLTARPYYRLPPFEEVSAYSQSNRGTLVKPYLAVDYNNMKSGDAEANYWPLEETIKVGNNNPANLNSNGYNRMLGDISGSPWYYRPKITKKPNGNKNVHEESYHRLHMGDISGYAGSKHHNRMGDPFDENIDVYNNYGDRLPERIMGEFPLEIDGVGARVKSDITGGSWRLGPYRNAKFQDENGQGWHVQNSNADWLRRQRDVDKEDELFPHFPNHAEYF